MKIQIDLKSAVCGLVIGIAAMFAIGAETSSSPVDKYRIATGTVEGTGAFALMVDTQTGKTWGIYIPKDFGNNKAGEFWNAK